MYELILELIGKGTRWEFTNQEIRIGRDPNCDLVLPTDEYPMVSRSHLLIRQAAERYWVEDLNTPGGTFVNGGQVQVSPLSDGDVLRLGVDGPELRANIVTSYQLENAAAPTRRQSTSDEAPTRFKRGASVKSRLAAQTAGKTTRSLISAAEAKGAVTPDESPENSELPSSGIPVPQVTPSVAGRNHGQPVPAAEPAQIPTIPPKPSLAMAPSAGPSPDKFQPDRAVELLPRDMAPDMELMERKLKTIRNLVVIAILLTMILGLGLLWHIWR